MPNTFSFNGSRKEYVKSIIKAGDVDPVMAKREHDLLEVPKRPGAIHMGTRTKLRPLVRVLLIERPDNLTFDRLKEDLAAWLTTEKAAPLTFDSDTDRTYFALLDDISDLEIFNDYEAKVTISFTCPEPYKQSDEKHVKIQASDYPKYSNIDILGHKETYPVVRLDVAKQLNYFALKTDGDFFQVGQAEMIDAPKPYEPETVVFTDDMTTIGGWTQASSVDNGHVTGEIASNGEWFYPSKVGTTIEEGVWQGPTLKKSIGVPLKDFRAQINLYLGNTPAIRTGMIEVYFLNASNETVAKLMLTDKFATTNNVIAGAALGGTGNRTWIHSGGAGMPEWWDNYSGILRIERKNNYWIAYFSTIENGVHTRPRGTGGILNFNDINGVYADDITQVQVAFRINPGGSELADMRIHGITIWKLNTPPEPQTLPIIAYAGDVLEFDHNKNTVRRNGEIVQGIKDFKSNFFPLKPGRNRLSIEPYDAGDLTVTYRERYL